MDEKRKQESMKTYEMGEGPCSGVGSRLPAASTPALLCGAFSTRDSSRLGGRDDRVRETATAHSRPPPNISPRPGVDLGFTTTERHTAPVGTARHVLARTPLSILPSPPRAISSAEPHTRSKRLTAACGAHVLSHCGFGNVKRVLNELCASTASALDRAAVTTGLPGAPAAGPLSASGK